MNPNERTSTNPAIAAAADAAGEVVGMATGRMPEMLQDCDRRLSRALSNTPDARLHAREAAAGVTGTPALLPFDAWAEYAMREGLLDMKGIAPDRQKTGTAFAAFAAGWNARAAAGVAPCDGGKQG